MGFMESGTLRALTELDTDLSPTDLYRFAQAVTQVKLRRVTTCVLNGRMGTLPGGARVVFVDTTQAKRLGNDAREDARLDGGCR